MVTKVLLGMVTMCSVVGAVQCSRLLVDAWDRRLRNLCTSRHGQ